MIFLPDDVLVDRAEGGVLPALVLGWRAIGPRDAPPFVLEVGHQYGGYACLQIVLSGLVFPLHDNLDRARRDPTPLLEAFRRISESQGRPPRGGRSAHPLVDAWGYSNGGDMTPPELREWDELLAKYYELPPLTAGAEALLTFAEPGPSLMGWRALRGSADPQARPVYAADRAALSQLAVARPTDRAPSPSAGLFLLWENSD